ncbi:ABC transporter permease [Salinibius halmophilus]|uniref:ABC transporter permease n=1 Tax=Salinibius halmophilus TaxID=1853216 RepID=UPI001314FAE6|nr:ABC transporter permease subunit [Salinibius halmophilus]
MLPIISGVVLTLLPAFGWLPVLNQQQLGWHIWQQLFIQPSFWAASGLTWWSGWLATLASLFIAALLLQYGFAQQRFALLSRWLSAMLAVPHAAYALGLFALLAATGWPARIWALGSGEQLPPQIALTQDPYGLSLALTLALREVPFLLLMALAAFRTLNLAPLLRQARLLGYGEPQAFWPVVVPQLLPVLRWPIMVVLAYNLGVVDVALITGPSLPPTLAVMVHQWFVDPDLTMRLVAAAGGIWLTLMIMLACALWWGIEKLIIAICMTRQWPRQTFGFAWLAKLSSILLLTAWLLGAAWLLFWAFARRWRFPDLWPEQWQLRSWLRTSSDWWPALVDTLVVGVASATLALVLVIGLLEGVGQLKRWQRPLLFVPLILPQVGFLFFVPGMLARIGIGYGYGAAITLHLLFVLPYSYLLLERAYLSLNLQYEQHALLLSKSRWRALWRVKWPLLAPAFASVFAVGFSVSVAQYLATLYASAGRIETITTLTVSAAGGGDRRLIAVFALLQWLLPFLVFLVMAWVSHWRSRWQRA